MQWDTSTPVWVEQWPLSAEKLQAAHTLVNKELQAGHLEPSVSPWNTPIFVIPKKAPGQFRLLHDLRAVNAVMRPMGPIQKGLPDPTAIPAGWPVIVLDIKDCFFSIPLCETDCEKFAFTLPALNHQKPNARYQWKVLPQGMRNSPTICQLVVSRILQPVRESSSGIIIHYMDDILVAHTTPSQVEALYAKVRDVLHQAGLEIHEAKIQKGPEIKFLGYEVSLDKVRIAPIKLQERIGTIHDVQKVLGTIQWLRSTAQIPPHLMLPLYELLKGNTPRDKVELTEQAREALKSIESLLNKGTVARWDPSQPLSLAVAIVTSGAIGVIFQGPLDKPTILKWIASSQVKTAFIRHTAMLRAMIEKGRKAAVQTYGKDPDIIVLPCGKTDIVSEWRHQEDLALALQSYGGTLSSGKHLSAFTHLRQLQVNIQPRIVDTPVCGPTLFTDASSRTHRAVVTWKVEDKWLMRTFEDPRQSVQSLEAKAIAMAMEVFPDSATNIVTDSMFAFKLVKNMYIAGMPTTPIAMQIENSLEKRTAVCAILHVNSHTNIQGFYQEGNQQADAEASRVYSLKDARFLHEILHLGPHALAKHCNIPVADARTVTQTCPYCVKTPLFEGGLNPRGLSSQDLWQTDFTWCEALKPRPWLCVTVDTYSGVIQATQHAKSTTRDAISHWSVVMAVLGIPKTIKTDNGSAFTSSQAKRWAEKWGIELKTGIPYNSTGQAIVERANRTLKERLLVIAEGEGFPTTHSIPVKYQQQILQLTLLSLNCFLRGLAKLAPMEKHWQKSEAWSKPKVQVCDPETRVWQKRMSFDYTGT